MAENEYRSITDHVVPGDSVNHQIKLEAADPSGPGGANHLYLAHIRAVPPGDIAYTLQFAFQKGPIKEVGVNGITNELLLAIVIDRMRGFQSGEFACRENAIVLTHLEEALMWLKKRTSDRIARGVEGTNVK